MEETWTGTIWESLLQADMLDRVMEVDEEVVVEEVDVEEVEKADEDKEEVVVDTTQMQIIIQMVEDIRTNIIKAYHQIKLQSRKVKTKLHLKLDALQEHSFTE